MGRGNQPGQIKFRPHFVHGFANSIFTIHPVQTANFGTRNGFAVSLLPFSPIDFSNLDNRCYPMAMHEIALTNTQTSAADVAVALFLPTSGTPSAIAGKGIASADARGRAAYVSTDAPNSVPTYGSGIVFAVWDDDGRRMLARLNLAQ